jgi:hypothetical protein
VPPAEGNADAANLKTKDLPKSQFYQRYPIYCSFFYYSSGTKPARLLNLFFRLNSMEQYGQFRAGFHRNAVCSHYIDKALRCFLAEVIK